MSSSSGKGSEIGTIGGGIVGSFFGSPTTGAALGGAIGGMFDDSPSSNSGGAPAHLTPSASVSPRFYDPASFTTRIPSAPGKFNAMAAALAGPQYVPKSYGGDGRGGGFGNLYGGSGTFAGGPNPAGAGQSGGNLGSANLNNLSWGNDNWTTASGYWSPDMSGHWHYTSVPSEDASAYRMIPEGGGLTNSTVFQSMTQAGRAQR